MPGGVLRVAMPDLAECVRQYHENDWRQPWMRKYGYEWIQTRAETINIAFRDWEHKWLYDREEFANRRAGVYDPLSAIRGNGTIERRGAQCRKGHND